MGRPGMPPTINCDMGEGFGLYRMGDDAALMPLIDLANVACGFHGSDPSIMRATVQLAKRHRVKVGAHPSLPDLAGLRPPRHGGHARGSDRFSNVPNRRSHCVSRSREYAAQS